jgi:serine/threonine protein phosphatase PrpC
MSKKQKIDSLLLLLQCNINSSMKAAGKSVRNAGKLPITRLNLLAVLVPLAVIIFMLNLMFLSSSLPQPAKSLVNHSPSKPLHAPQKADDDEEEPCPDFGCPIYPAEMNDYLNELFSEMFVHKNRTESFSFGTKNMAALTQMGKSHIFNQDRALVISPYRTKQTKDDDTSFLMGIFDGHGREGHYVASYAARELPERLAAKLNALDDDADVSDEQIIQMLIDTFVEVDIYAPPNAMRGGSTASVTLRRGSKLYVANAGDSQTVVVTVQKKNDQLETEIAYMSRKDKPTLPDEKARIEGLGGNIWVNKKTGDARVNVYSVAAREGIGLAMSRAIGDWEWKPIGVTAEPLVNVVDLKDHNNAFIITASDGLWDVRRREFYANQFSESFYGGAEEPLFKLWDVIKKVTPQNKDWYRDDITAIVMKLEGT